MIDKINNNPTKMKRLIAKLIVVIGRISRIIPDKIFLDAQFYLINKRVIDWTSPNTFNEKLAWLKVYGRKEIYTKMVDKFEAKEIVAGIIGKEYVVKNYGVYDDWSKIEWDNMPNQFVIKCTHDSGGAFICRDKTTYDFCSTEKIIRKNLKKNHWIGGREWPYKNVRPRIIVDEFLDDHTGKELNDYKFWCFNGVPRYMYYTVKSKNIYENFYDMNFEPVSINHGFKRHKPEFKKPAAFDEMKMLASKLSKGIPFVRIDFFFVNCKIYFGEFTFYDWGGLKPFSDNWDEVLGSYLKLPIND